MVEVQVLHCNQRVLYCRAPSCFFVQSITTSPAIPSHACSCFYKMNDTHRRRYVPTLQGTHTVCVLRRSDSTRGRCYNLKTTAKLPCSCFGFDTKVTGLHRPVGGRLLPREENSTHFFAEGRVSGTKPTFHAGMHTAGAANALDGVECGAAEHSIFGHST